MGTIGDLYEIPGEVKFEWKINDFSRITPEANLRYESPKFLFSGASWEIRIYPNGETKNESDGWISLYLARMSTGFPLTITYSFSFKTAGGKAYTRTYTNVIDKKNTGWGVSKFMLRSQLVEKKIQLLSSDVLTLICTMKNSELVNVVAGSFFSRLQKMSDNFKEAFTKAKNTDFLLKVDGENIGAHRMVLESRCPVFEDIFVHDVSEHEASEASVRDSDKYTLEAILTHMYSGDIDKLTTENALSLYAAAVKYDIKDLKELCLNFILRNLSVEWVCDVIKFSEKHKMDEISYSARQYMKENAGKIIDSENWKKFLKENHNLCNELVRHLIKGLLERRCN